MTSESKTVERLKFAILALAIVGLLLAAFAGCTVTPKPSPARHVAKYVGNSLDSGLVAILYEHPETKTGFLGFLVSQGWVLSYDTLASSYGYLLQPPAHPGAGIAPASPEVLAAHSMSAGFVVTAQTMVAWRDMKTMPGLGREKEGVISKALNALP